MVIIPCQVEHSHTGIGRAAWVRNVSPLVWVECPRHESFRRYSSDCMLPHLLSYCWTLLIVWVRIILYGVSASYRFYAKTDVLSDGCLAFTFKPGPVLQVWFICTFCFVFVRFLLLIALDKKENNIHFVQKPYPLVISEASDIFSREGVLLLSI